MPMSIAMVYLYIPCNSIVYLYGQEEIQHWHVGHFTFACVLPKVEFILSPLLTKL